MRYAATNANDSFTALSTAPLGPEILLSPFGVVEPDRLNFQFLRGSLKTAQPPR